MNYTGLVKCADAKDDAIYGLTNIGVGAGLGAIGGGLLSRIGEKDIPRNERVKRALMMMLHGGVIGGSMAGLADNIADWRIGDQLRNTLSLYKDASATPNQTRMNNIQNALPDAGVGAAIGAGIGGLAGLIGPKKNRIRRALMMMLGGGLVGGGAAGIASYNDKSLIAAIQDKLDLWRAQRQDAQNLEQYPTNAEDYYRFAPQPGELDAMKAMNDEKIALIEDEQAASQHPTNSEAYYLGLK